MGRDLTLVICDYLNIITSNEQTIDYRHELIQKKLFIEESCIYCAPEQFGVYWAEVNEILAKYNPTFIANTWAQAVLAICRGEYDNPVLCEFKNLYRSQI